MMPLSDIEGHAMRVQVRWLMIAVAVVGLVLGLVVHIRVLVHDEDDFALPILMLEAFAASVLVAIALAVGFVIRSVRKDDTYAAQLRRDDIPARCPLPLAGTDPPDWEGR
jgi:bacteriorhodopsin